MRENGDVELLGVVVVALFIRFSLLALIWGK
jgi:hypothetical protein